MSTAFHLQMDGAVEKANHWIGQTLQTVTSNNQHIWAEEFPMVEFTLNSIVSVTTGYSPFKLTYGYLPQIK